MLKLNEELPNSVGFAAVICISSAILLVLLSISSQGEAIQIQIMLPLVAYLLIVGFGLFYLEEWAYWGFVLIALLSSLNIISDFLLLIVGISPGLVTLLLELLQLSMLVVFLFYFISPKTRKEFGMKPLW